MKIRRVPRSYSIECPCGWSVGPTFAWWAELRSQLHDLFAGPKLRAFHRKAEDETRDRLGLPRRYS